ncbi:MAG: hypothetical protein LBI62_03365 [Candidatus Accumulibacter sp.]|nr:hypothetical protein [Accumulibacter sp.]
MRRSDREDGKVKNETLGNLSHLPDHLVDIIRRSLRGERFVPVAEAFEVTSSLPWGHVQAVRSAMKRLKFASLLGSKSSRERDLVMAMVASRIVSPSSKLATTRGWHTTSLASDFGVSDADEEDLYAAMDWLLARQDSIQKKLAARHLKTGGRVLYDLSSSCFEGTHCPLAQLGYNRDGKKGLLQVNYGLMTDARGCPVAVTVHEGNVSDSKTFLSEVERLCGEFGIEEVVLVRAHILLCMLAYYVEWHMREAWRELTFADADRSAQSSRDPVAPAQRSPAAKAEASRRRLDDGTPAYGFQTLMADLSTLVRNTCRDPSAAPDTPPFEVITTPTPTQRRALDLIEQIGTQTETGTPDS